jgi:hypothetical protein
MERRQTIESVTDAGETGPRLGARHERKCRRGAAWERFLNAWLRNVKTETKKATANAVRVRRRESRSDEDFAVSHLAELTIIDLSTGAAGASERVIN